MDFWSRLLTRNPLSSGTSRKDAAKDPVRRLHRFEKEYSQLLQIWRKSSNLSRDEDAAEAIEAQIKELTNMLSDESRRPLPHPCIAFASVKQMYVPIAKIATTSYNEWIIKEAVWFFGTLIESEEEAFVENRFFAASLTNLLVRITGANSIRLDPDIEERVVELAFNITTKIRLDPGILPTWFKESESTAVVDKPQDSHERFAGRTQKEDFPLFYLLVDYIHHEGKVGDFARTGLLYVIEAASSSVALEQWIVESDLSTLMATGLGALYSQLSRKLVIDHPPNELPPALAFSDFEHPKSTYEIVSSCTPEYQVQLDTFLSHLLFWQDVLNHCRSVEVKQTLLEHFQVIFLQQLLYPSLLESSDIDGGSSVAVLTYLRRVLESLDHPDMINLILHYLLALPDMVPSVQPGTRDMVSLARKRKSMDLATMMASKNDTTATPLLFNLVDLILACLRSHSQQTIHVTLQLVSTILKRHHRYAVFTLLHTESTHGEGVRRTTGAHHQEVEFFMSLAGVIGGQDNFDGIYEDVLKDTAIRLESHPCSLKLVAPKVSTNNHKLPAIPDSLPGAPRDVRSHTLRPDDPLLNSLLDRLETFFINPVETNLSVTETIFDLAVCGYMNIEGWLLRHPDKYTFNDDLGDEEADDEAAAAPLDPDSPSYAEYQARQAMKKCRRRPQWIPSRLPRLLNVLQLLADQVATYRETIPRFDDLLQQRREAFQTADAAVALQAAMRNTIKSQGQGQQLPPSTPGRERTSLDSDRNASPARPSALEGFAQRILSELGTPSRSSSPRGRKDVPPSSSSRGGYGFSTPPPLPPGALPGHGYDTPSKGGAGAGMRSYSPSSQAGSLDGRDGAVTSQVAAFQAVDQTILARKVGLPSVEKGEGKMKKREKAKEKVVPIPLDFGKELPAVPVGDGGDDAEEGGDESGGVDGVSESVRAKGQEEEHVEADEEAEGEDQSEVPASDIGDVPASEGLSEEEKLVSVSHVLTNAIILQSFLFELASLVQCRGALFDEIRFV